MRIVKQLTFLLAIGGMAVGWSCPAKAAVVNVTVTVQNLAPVNSVAFAPLRVGFNNGTFDSFDINTAATAPIISIAELGTGRDWFPAFAAADPGAVLGTVGGRLDIGMSASQTFTVDSSTNQFFTFASMVVPSNDLFLGNDNPQGFRILDNAGNLLISEINQTAGQIWNAGSERTNPLNAAFLVGGTTANRDPENGVVTFDFSELAAFNGLTTGAGYVFDSTGLTAGTNIARITFSVSAVPEPSSLALLGLVGYALEKYQLDLASGVLAVLLTSGCTLAIVAVLISSDQLLRIIFMPVQSESPLGGLSSQATQRHNPLSFAWSWLFLPLAIDHPAET